MALQGSDPRPVDLHLDRHRDLQIMWSDGVHQVIPLGALRRACPCATCRAQREQAAANPLHVLPAASARPDALAAEGLELVGVYGVKVRWSDGHDAGIFNYRILRTLGSGGTTE